MLGPSVDLDASARSCKSYCQIFDLTVTLTLNGQTSWRLRFGELLADIMCTHGWCGLYKFLFTYLLIVSPRIISSLAVSSLCRMWSWYFEPIQVD